MEFPSGVIAIGNNLVKGYNKLRSITIPNGVTSIDYRSFSECQNLQSVIIPDSVKSIGPMAFTYCPHLIIYGSTGSYAETYAKETGIRFSTGKPDGTKPAPLAHNIDTAAEWARDGINSAAGKGIIGGWFISANLNNISYSEKINRSNFSVLVINFIASRIGWDAYNALLSETELNEKWFSDTNMTGPLIAYAFGIMDGTKAPTDTDPGLFNPGGTVTREQAATMIMRTCKFLGMDVSNSPTYEFADQNEISDWAVDAVNFVKANGLMGGVGGNNFNPKGTYTWQESIVTLDRIK